MSTTCPSCSTAAPSPAATQPALLKRLGQAEEVTRLLGPYLLALLPAVWVDAFYRWVGAGSLGEVAGVPTCLGMEDLEVSQVWVPVL